jgi:hypothetical protein
MYKRLGFYIDMSKLSMRAAFRICIILIVTVIPAALPAQNGSNQKTAGSENFIRIRGLDGNMLTVPADGDEDGDGISNQLEIDGYYWNSDSLKILPWNGDPNQVHYITDPLQASTDQDPYSDYTEVSGVNLDVGVLPPEDHPLVAARPRINVKMVSYDVIPLVTITDAQGGSQSSSYTNEVSNSTTNSVEVTDQAEMGTSGINGSVSVSSSYSETETYTQSTTSSSELNWNQARSTQPDRAARLELIVYMENSGSTEALDVIPTVNLKLGDKIISTFNLPEAVSLTPKNTAGSKTSNFNVSSANGQDITVTLDELRAIQIGTPLTLEVIQMQANVETLDNMNNSITKSWNQYMGDIDLVSVDVIATIGAETRRHQVFAGWTRWDPQFSFQDILSMIFNVDQSNGQTRIENRVYPDEWYISSPSQAVLDEWNQAGRPANVLPLRMHPGTKMVMMSPGADANPVVNLAAYSTLPGDTSAYSRILVSAVPQNFPISSVTAQVPINGQVLTDTLSLNQEGFYTNSIPLEGVPDGPGTVYVRNARGDVTQSTISLPAFYTSAADVKAYSSFVPDPGGDFWIYQNGDPDKPLLLYCLFYNENGDSLQAPREYLTLHATGQSTNYADWLSDTNYLRVYFDKIRLNPFTLKVDNFDTTFASLQWIRNDTDPFLGPVNPSFGKVSFNFAHLDTALASINLSGTPFHVPTTLGVAVAERGANVRINTDRSGQIISVMATQPAGYLLDSQGAVGFQGDSLQLVMGSDYTPAIYGNTLSGSAALFNQLADDGYITMGSPASLEVDEAITIEAWIFPTGPGVDTSYGGIIVNKEGAYELARFGDGSIRVALANSNPGWRWISTGLFAPENQWSHIAAVYDNSIGALKFYVNEKSGVIYGGSPASGTIGNFYTDKHEFRVGSRQVLPPNQIFQGMIDEVRIWNIPRSPAQIQSTVGDTLGAKYYSTADSGLIGYWRFDELEDLGAGNPGLNDVRDYSVNANHGDLVGDVLLSSFVTGIKTPASHGVKKTFELFQNYPNPFNPSTTISYVLPKAEKVELTIYNMLGQKIRILVSGQQSAGRKQVVWDGQNSNGIKVASGVYLYRLSTASFSKAHRMILTR